MKQSFDWNDAKLFIAVARSGGLVGARAKTGLSSPTLGRRITALEEALNCRLFKREPRQYVLTKQGQEFLTYAEEMETSANDILCWNAKDADIQKVRISGGAWTILRLCENLQHFWKADDIWQPEFIADNQRLNIARREIDIGIRNKRPTEPWLAARHIGHVEYAVYCAASNIDSDSLKWISLSEHRVLPPTSVWVMENHSNDIGFTISQPILGLSLMRQAEAKMLIPTFIGDGQPDLARISEPIAELRSEQWLVMHENERHQPAIRSAINGLAEYLT